VPIAYPVGLPTVLATKRTSKGAAFGMASPRRGTPYVEPTGTDTPTVFAVEWLLSEADAAVLINWVEVTLERGTLEFTIPLRTETGLREITGNFLPQGLLDRQRDGPLWRYSASIVSRSGTGPLIAPPPPPPPPPPAPGPSGYFLSRWDNSIIFTAGETGLDVTAQLEQAAFDADTGSYTLALPPWALRFNKSFRCNRIRGVRGLSVLVPEEPFNAAATFGNEFVITNRNFSQLWNPATAEDCSYTDFELRIGLQRNMGGIGIAGTRRSRFEGLRLKAIRTLNGLGRAYPVLSLIDFYALCRDGKVVDCDLDNVTGAYGTGGTRFSPDGGACIWVRNFRLSNLPLATLQSTAPADVAATLAEAEEWVTENIEIHGNRMTHMTSDEVLSVYGVTGVTRNCTAHHNKIIGMPTIGGVHHASWISIFPLRQFTGGAVPLFDALGKTAAVYDNSFHDNYIDDSAAMYDVMRIGANPNPANPNTDGYNRCFNNRSYNNTVIWRRSADPVTGPKAVYVADGSPGGLDPDIISTIIKCQDGVFGVAYTSDTSGNTSTDDTAIADPTGAAVNQGFGGFQRLTNAETFGNIFIGITSCRFVFGGKVEAAYSPFVNCRSVVGTNYRQNLAGGVVYEINDGQPGVYGLKDTVGESYGRLVSVGGLTPSGSSVGVYNNDVQFLGAASSHPILQNLAPAAGATIRARNNTSRGTSAAITAGTGDINRASNDWNGTLD
jgi:hypothetical protein